MSTVQLPTYRAVRPAVYLLGFVLLLLPIGEIVTTAWPFAYDQPLWRFSIGSMAGVSSATMLLGMLVLLIAAVADDSRSMMWMVFAITTIAVLVYWVGGAAFILDAVQLNGRVTQQDPGKFKLSAAWVLVKLLISGVAAVSMAICAMKAIRRSDRPLRTAAGRTEVLVPR